MSTLCGKSQQTWTVFMLNSVFIDGRIILLAHGHRAIGLLCGQAICHKPAMAEGTMFRDFSCL